MGSSDDDQGRETSLGTGPFPRRRSLFVANGPSNDVSVIDVASEKEVGRIKAGEGPWGVAVVPTPADRVNRR